ncbi:MAG: hypothetical protein PHX18_05890 [Candidatus Gastranaerophilales bacterium]|nr:hypothetical protein [Candidatus Gastranaerophilales bacterium]
MEFFNVLGEIKRNRGQFKKWEETGHNDDLRRQALYDAHKPSVEKMQTA